MIGKKAIRFLFSLSWDASMTARSWPLDRTQTEPPLPFPAISIELGGERRERREEYQADVNVAVCRIH